MGLSRLHDELFMRDTRYACDFWEEHGQNFAAMLYELLTEESLLKIHQVAKETSLEFNIRCQALSREDNENLVRAAYDRLALLIQPDRNFGNTEAPTAPEGFNAKKFLVDGMNSYFRVLALAREEAGKPLREIYLQHKDQCKDFVEPLLPEGYTLDQGCELFLPQLQVYFAYLIWKYDQAMEGKLVRDYFNDFQRAKDNMVDPQNVEEMWKNIGRKGGDNEDFELPTHPENDNAKAGQKNESWIFQESASRQRDAVDGYWKERRSEIMEAYNELSSENKRILFAEVREIIARIGNGIYQNVLIYCPELNPAKISGEDTTKGEFSVHSFEELVQQVRNQKELPKINPKNEDEVIKILKDEAYGDKFVRTLSQKMGPSGKFLPLVAVSRQHLLFVFCHLCFVKLLDISLSKAIETIPGCADMEESDMDFKFPFSTREQRESVPIGKPPVPKLQKTVPPPKVEEVSSDEPVSTPQIKSNVCSEPGCKKVQEEGQKFQVCGYCKKGPKSVPYCSRECQVKHWKEGHKKECFKNKM